MKDTLGHQTEEEKILDDIKYRNARIRALDITMKKLQVEIASAEDREKQTLSDEEVDGALRNIANPSFVNHNLIVTPTSARSYTEMKEEYYKLMQERESLAFDRLIGNMRADFAAAKNPRPSVPVSPFASSTVSTASSKNEEDDAHAIVRKVLELVGDVI